jgi:hypothetical protein
MRLFAAAKKKNEAALRQRAAGERPAASMQDSPGGLSEDVAGRGAGWRIKTQSAVAAAISESLSRHRHRQSS